MGELTLDKQTVCQRCAECNANFTVVRGSVYDSGQPFALYLIALHGHSPDGRLGHLAIAVLDLSANEHRPIAAAMIVIAMPKQFGFSLVDWAESPWRDESYLGQLLNRDDARASSHRAKFLEIAEQIVDELPEVRTYFG